MTIQNPVSNNSTADLTGQTEQILKEIEYVKKLIDQQLAYGTKRVYQSDWRIFDAWCIERNYHATNATPEIISMFIGSQFYEGLHPSTLNRRLAAIKFAYKCLNKHSPTDDMLVKATLKGIRRDKKAPPVNAKKAATTPILKKMVQLCNTNTLKDIRDRALLLLTFAGAFRRSELVAVNVEDITFTNKGMEIKIHRSKTDQEGEGYTKVIMPAKEDKMYCPIITLKNWLDKSQIKNGALFRGINKHNQISKTRLSDDAVYYIIKRFALELGYGDDEISAHSFRAGFVTSAYENGALPTKIMEQAGMKSMQTVHRYIRHAERYENHAGEDLL